MLERTIKHNITAIIQARMGSNRLPGKMLAPIINGKGALELMLERVSGSKLINSIIVATSTNKIDDPLEELCINKNINVFRGDEFDVLDRFYRAALAYNAHDYLVRLTGDCPLHDPNVIDSVIKKIDFEQMQYVANINPPTYPDGMDVEVFSFKALETSWKEARLESEREHVTLFIRNHPLKFKSANVENDLDYSKIRITLDEQNDLELIRFIFKKFYGKKNFGINEIIKFLLSNKQLCAINKDILRDEGLKNSLIVDKMVK